MTIEDAAELRLQQPHVVRLESRPAGVEGRGEVTIRDLLRNALRMRPDRIVIGEVRGPEALDLLTALNTGHDGALSTVHANSPADALARLETLALMAGVGLPHAAIAEQVRRGIDLVVHMERRGRRRPGRQRDRGGRRGPGVPRFAAWPDGERSPAAAADRWSAPLAGGLLALAAREALLASPAAARWVRLALEPLRRAGREGYAPSSGERRRLAALGGAGRGRSPAGSSAGPALALPLAVAGPAAAGWAISSRRRRYRARGRALAAGSGDRGRRLARRRPLACAPRCRRRPPTSTGRRRRSWPGSAPSSTSAPRPATAIAAWRRRMRSARVDAFAAALLSQRLAGGDLAGAAAPLRRRRRRARPGRRGRPLGDRPGPLHRPAGGRDADRRRPLRRAARSPASSPSCSARRSAALLLALAAALQLVGFVAIKRLSRVVE